MANQQKLFDCLPFPPLENNSTLQRKKVKQTTAKQYEEESRTRKFLPVWWENYPWLCFDSDNNKMYCQVCLTVNGVFKNWKRTEFLLVLFNANACLHVGDDVIHWKQNLFLFCVLLWKSFSFEQLVLLMSVELCDDIKTKFSSQLKKKNGQVHFQGWATKISQGQVK